MVLRELMVVHRRERLLLLRCWGVLVDHTHARQDLHHRMGLFLAHWLAEKARGALVQWCEVTQARLFQRACAWNLVKKVGRTIQARP